MLRNIVCTAVITVFGWSANAEIVAGFETDYLAMQVQSTAWVDIVADIPEADATVGWGLDLAVLDPGIATWTGNLVIGDLWIPAERDDDGLAGLSFDPIWGEDVVLASVEFQSISGGETVAELSVTPGDLNEGFALFPSGFAEVSFRSLTIIPEPASLGLFVIGALVFARRRV
jgi:hypothetical protein